ncbi:hypothetical protein [Actinokineospora cianjurensis]|uniref:Uncharacterized protein n=1 Tax=Actinokineospora cianjurensis TaxID=585224 RepID=A0A421B229_9PSEU|nr:hypothetical protein [Actinokineospora cianjurensis]RLK58398.1 hypothetical protein CLV68_4498 [Actinokineospora cianjurensis]
MTNAGTAPWFWGGDPRILAVVLAALVMLGFFVESLASPNPLALAKLLVSTVVLYVTLWSATS